MISENDLAEDILRYISCGEKDSRRHARRMLASAALLSACKECQLALRANSQREKEFSYELGVLKLAIAQAE